MLKRRRRRWCRSDTTTPARRAKWTGRRRSNSAAAGCPRAFRRIFICANPKPGANGCRLRTRPENWRPSTVWARPSNRCGSPTLAGKYIRPSNVAAGQTAGLIPSGHSAASEQLGAGEFLRAIGFATQSTWLEIGREDISCRHLHRRAGRKPVHRKRAGTGGQPQTHKNLAVVFGILGSA